MDRRAFRRRTAAERLQVNRERISEPRPHPGVNAFKQEATMAKEQIREHMEVLGSDGQHVGVVDHLEGKNQIKLTKTDPEAQGIHHFIPVDWVDHVDDHVHLNRSSHEAKREWKPGPM
jgi:hypothetical protein